jgi:hypothetical protein
VEFGFPSEQPVMPSYAIAKLDFTLFRANIVVLGYVLAPASLSNDPRNPNYAAEVSHFRGYASQFRAPYYYDYVPPGSIVAYTRLFVHCNTPPEELTLAQQTGAAYRSIDYGYCTYASFPALMAIGIAWTALISYLAGGITGLLFQRKWRPYGRLGLWNFATLIALRIRLTRHHEVKHPRLFTIAFSLTFFAFNFAASNLLTLLFGSYWPGWS